MEDYYPNLDDFKRLCDQADVIPVYRELLADALTPVSAYRRLAQPLDAPASDYSFLLESVVGGEKIARYSFVSADPSMSISVNGDVITKTDSEGQVETVNCHDPLGELHRILDEFKPIHHESLPRFAGGLVGYAGYDMVRYYEDFGAGPKDDRNLPEMSFGLYRTMVIFDHVFKTIKVVANAFVKDDQDAAYQEAVDMIESVITKLQTSAGENVGSISMVPDKDIDYVSNFTKSEYMDVVEGCKEYIRAGDIFQVVPSQRLTVQTTATPLDCYRSLRVVNPSPFMFILNTPETTLVGSSPEILCRVEDDVVTNRPLAGTRPRGKTTEEDIALEQDLLADQKELAEHTMLVDLARNDVGIVAEPNSIELSELMTVERYSHVMHIVSDVKGKLAAGKTSFDAIKAALPVGTVSGSPKIRAMEIIDEFEPTRRGPYAGGVGYLDFSGNMDTCIAIRTMVFADGNVYVQAGGGVVADSDPETEYQETLNKARALLRAISIAENGLS